MFEAICSICGKQMKPYNDSIDALIFSYSEEDESGNIVADHYGQHLHCENEHYAVRWWKDQPPSDFNHNLMPTDDWSMLSGYYDTTGIQSEK